MPPSPHLKRRLLGSLLAFLGIIACLWAWVILASWQTAQKETGSRYQTLSIALSEQIEAIFRSEAVVLDSLAAEVGRQNPAEVPEKEWFDAFHRHLARYNLDGPVPLHALFLVDAQGRSKATSVGYPTNPVDSSQRGYFLYHRDHPGGGNYISTVSRSMVTGYWVVFFTRRLDGPQGEFAGVVGMTIRTEVFQKLYNTMSMPAESSLSIFKTDGSPVFRLPFARNFPTTRVTDLPAFKAIVAAQNGVIEAPSPYDQKRKIVGFSTGRQYPIVTILSGDQADAFGAWQATALQLSGIGALILLLLAGLVVFTMKQIDRLQLAIVHSARAEAASTAKSQFLSNMSHEIRTPMNAVLGFAQLLIQDPALGPEARRRVEIILKSGNHLLSIINDILELSRIESGHTKLVTGPVDVAALVEEVASFFQPRLAETGVEFHWTWDKAAPSYFATDGAKLRKILLNLVGNAVKYTPRGEIHLEGRYHTPDQLTFEVRDTGIGLSPDEVETLFQPFQRTKSGEKTASGTGLGLSIGRETARLMGGDITVESEVGRGSCFRLALRAPATMAPTLSPGRRNRVHLAEDQVGTKILVVDDNGDNRLLLAELLEPMGFQVLQAPSGAVALEMVAGEHPALVLLDRRMPGMDGEEVARRLREAHGTQTPVLIGLTASAFAGDQSAFEQSGLNGFLTKPFLLDDLVECLGLRAGFRFENQPQSRGSQTVTAEPPRGETPVPLAPGWADQFRAALARGSVSELRKLAQTLRASDPEKAGWVEDRLRAYDLVSLGTWLQGQQGGTQ